MKTYFLTTLAVTLSFLAVAPDALAQSKFLDPYPNDWAGPGEQPLPPTLPSESLQSQGASTAQVRMAYLIPSNRTAQVDAVQSYQMAMLYTRDWYRDQMRAHGHGECTLNLETEPDGVTPLIHVVPVVETDAYLRGDIWPRIITAASNAGLSIWSSGEVWVLIPEAHVENPDGSIDGGVALGASFGSGNDPGVAMLGSDGLARFKYLADDRSYAGLSLPELGAYPLVQSVSFPWFEGTTLSSVASSILGALMHELGHALGLPHDNRNDANFHGNLMGNGLRGVRGNFFPASYSSDQAWLSLASAQALSTSRYLGGTEDENIKPTANISTSGNTATTNGLLPIAFTAADGSDLVAAHLVFDGSRVAEMAISGTSFSGSFLTPLFEEGVQGTYRVVVFDTHGNKQTADSLITPTAGLNRAPRANFNVSRSIGFPFESVTLNASPSVDPDPGSVLTYEWDLDGDGIFDTTPTTTSTRVLVLDIPGVREVSARVTDQLNATSVSTPLLVETHFPQTGISVIPPGAVSLNWPSRIGLVYQITGAGDLDFSSPAVLPDQDGNGGTITLSDNLAPSGRYFYRNVITRRSNP